MCVEIQKEREERRRSQVFFLDFRVLGGGRKEEESMQQQTSTTTTDTRVNNRGRESARARVPQIHIKQNWGERSSSGESMRKKGNQQTENQLPLKKDKKLNNNKKLISRSQPGDPCVWMIILN